MPTEVLKINESQMQAQVSDIKQAVENYKSFGTKPFDEEIAALDDMNTDFIAKFKVMLGDMNDGNSKIVENLEEVASLSEEIIKTFQKIDNDAASSMGFSREG